MSECGSFLVKQEYIYFFGQFMRGIIDDTFWPTCLCKGRTRLNLVTRLVRSSPACRTLVRGIIVQKCCPPCGMAANLMLRGRGKEVSNLLGWLVLYTRLSHVFFFKEFELVRNAMYTDPDDQGIWLYHRWLVGSGECRWRRIQGCRC